MTWNTHSVGNIQHSTAAERGRRTFPVMNPEAHGTHLPKHMRTHRPPVHWFSQSRPTTCQFQNKVNKTYTFQAAGKGATIFPHCWQVPSTEAALDNPHLNAPGHVLGLLWQPSHHPTSQRCHWWACNGWQGNCPLPPGLLLEPADTSRPSSVTHTSVYYLSTSMPTPQFLTAHVRLSHIPFPVFPSSQTLEQLFT